MPVFNWYKNYLTWFYHRECIGSAQRYEEAPKLKLEQIEALNLFDQIANEKTVYLGMQFRPGDMQFAYNHIYCTTGQNLSIGQIPINDVIYYGFGWPCLMIDHGQSLLHNVMAQLKLEYVGALRLVRQC